MRFSLFTKSGLIAALMFFFVAGGIIIAQEKTTRRFDAVTSEINVTDDNGNPISKAQVIIGQGIKYLETDETGSVSFQALTTDNIQIYKPGYEKMVLSVGNLLSSNGSVKLIKSKLFMTSDDLVPLPFLKMKKGDITGSFTLIKDNQLEKYPGADLRNAFTGLAAGLEVIENNGATGISLEEKYGLYGASEKLTMTMRGGSPLIIIDGMPGDLTEIQLNPNEVELVSVLNDITARSMYGPMAANGIILIKTKRGNTNERFLNVNLESGFSMVDRFPGWVSGDSYARLNNMARENSNLNPLYSITDIASYAENDPYDMYHPSSNYREMLLRNTKSYKRANVSAQGGNNVVQYSASLGFTNEGDIYKIGSVADFNRLNVLSNVDVNISNKLKASFDIFAGLSLRRSPNYGFNTTLDILEFSRVIDDITTISPIAFPVYAKNDPDLGDPWYGITPVFSDNPVGRIIDNGYYNEIGRTGKISASLDYDLSGLTKGLKSRTFIGLDASYLLRVGKEVDFIAYNVLPTQTSVGTDTIILSKAHDGMDSPGQQNLHNFYYNRIAVYENLSYARSFGNSEIQSTLTYSLFRQLRAGFDEPAREQNLIWTGFYSFNDRYKFQGVLNYAGAYYLDKGNRYRLFPSLGASWIISEEDFMANMKSINYLKLFVEGGVIGNQRFLSPYYYQDNWSGNMSGTAFGPYSTNPWFGSLQDNQVYRTYPSRIGNPDLSWETIKEISFGLDALFFDHKIAFGLSLYNKIHDNQISQLNNSIPLVTGSSVAFPWFNYNKTRYYGLESRVQFTEKIGELGFSVGVNATLQDNKVLRYDEPDYRFDYQSQVGKRNDSYWGQTYLGKYKSDAEALLIPPVFDPVLHEGDLKYDDLNDDKIIDDNDKSVVGHTNPLLFYALNLKLFYKNFDMTVIGSGRALFDMPMTNRYFWNGWGDNNYSNFVKDNIGGAYPKLSYYKINNNFINSDFWLAKGGYFKIQNVEIAYSIPSNKLQRIGSKGVRIYLRSSNLLTLTKINEVDPESVNSGIDRYPLYKTFTGGIKLTF